MSTDVTVFTLARGSVTPSSPWGAVHVRDHRGDRGGRHVLAFDPRLDHPVQLRVRVALAQTGETLRLALNPV